MRMSTGLIAVLLLACGLALHAGGALADPATPRSERVAQYGQWYVVRKPASYVLAETGKRGRYNLCSAMFFGQSASLEFEAKNERAWAIYVAAKGWRYPVARRALSLRSGRQAIRLPRALYGGAMISGMSHDLSAGKPISMRTLQAFMAQGRPIEILDSKGRRLVSFPNSGDELTRAFRQAIACSVRAAPG